MRVLGVALAGFLALAAADEPQLTEAQKAELAQYFGFGPMEIYKLKPGIGLLRLADLNVDGRTDVLVWNGYQSRFELFLQPDPDAPAETVSPPLERNEVPDRGHLRRTSVPVSSGVAAAAVAELTGDGRPDIVFFGEPKELVVLPGRAEGGFGPAEGLRAPEGAPRPGSLCTGDFNHDGRTDVALLGGEVLLIYLQKPEGGLAKPLRLVHGIQSPMLMLAGDLDGDGRDDLIIGADDPRYGIYVCLQQPGGGLAAMRPVKVARTRSLTLAAPQAGRAGHDLYAIEYASGRLKHYRWQMPRETGVAADWPLHVHSYPVKSSAKRRPLALGDVDGDRLVDCVVVDPDAAQMILFRGEPRGLGAGAAFPALVKTTDVCLADLDGDGRDEVLTASAEEKMIGVSRYQDGRLTFPDELPAEGAPCVLAVGGLTAGGPGDRLAYVTRIGDAYALRVVAAGAGGGPEAGCELGKLEDDPAGLLFVDLNQDGRNDLLLFVRYSPPLALLQDGAGQFAPFRGAETRSALLKETGIEGSAVVDVTGDGRPEVLLAQGNLVRALRIEEGRWAVVDQYNPETADAEITGLAALSGGAGGPALVMYERKAGDLLVQQRRADGAYGVVQTVPAGAFDLTAMQRLPIGPAGEDAVLLADARRLAVLVPDEKAATLVEQDAYETDARDAWLGDAVVGDINHDGVRDVAVVDMGRAAIEVLTTPPGGGLVRAARFQVFQGKRFAEAPDARGEPREVLIGELTGDGIDDIVLLVHDRLIIYPGQ